MAVGANLTNDAEDAELAREDAAITRKRDEAARDDPFVAALRESLGSKGYEKYIAHDAWVNAVTDKYVEIELSLAAGDQPAKPLLAQICAAVQDADPDALAEIKSNTNEIVASCLKTGPSYKRH